MPKRTRKSSFVVEIASDEPVHSPFDRSLDLLLALAVREVNAEQCGLYEYAEFTATLIEQKRLPHPAGSVETASIEVPVATGAWLLNLRELEHIGSSAFEHPEAGGFPEVAANGFETFLVLPFLHAGALIGLLTFGWRKPAALRERQIRSVREIASAISDVTIRARQSSFTIHLANRISQLQAELANGKIADRARGLLIENRSDAGEVVQHHVSRVLESMSVSVGLQEQLEKLESEVKDRRIVGQAKEFLQEALHLSEEEAYLQLRNTSRQSRRRLPDVASEILRNAGAKAAQG